MRFSLYGVQQRRVVLACWLLVAAFGSCLPIFGQDKQQKTQARPVNPLQQLFRQILPASGKSPSRPSEDQKRPTPSERSRPDKDVFDFSVPHEQEADDLLRRARSLLDQQRWADAYRVIQLLLSRSEDTLWFDERGQWRSVRAEAFRLLRRFPQSARRLLAAAQQAAAARALTEAERSGRVEQLAEVAWRYFLTDAGRRAAVAVASYHFDRAEYVAASAWFERLLLLERSLPPETMAQAAAAFLASGQLQTARRLLDQLRQADSSDKTWNLRQLQELLPRIDEAPVVRCWPIAGATPRRNGRAAVEKVLPAPRWSSSLTEVPGLQAKLRENVLRQTRLGVSLLPTLIPITADDVVVFRDFRGLRAHQVSTGKQLWFRPLSASPEEAPMEAFGLALLRQSDRSGLLQRFLFSDPLSGLLSCDGQRVYCAERRGILESDAGRQGFGGFGQGAMPFPISVPLHARRQSTSNSLRAYDLHTGEILWQVGGPDAGMDDPLAGVLFLGPPLPFRRRLFAAGLHQREVRLYCLQPETGRLVWSQQLGSIEDHSAASRLTRWPLSVAFGSGVLLCPNGTGWLLAFDPVGRTFLWACRYSPRQQTADRRWPAMQQRMAFAMKNAGHLWPCNLPMVVGRRVVFTPFEQDVLICVDLATGETLWTQQRGRMLYVVGAVKKAAFVVYPTYIQAVSLDDGRLLWREEFPQGTRPAGRGMLAKQRIFVPLSDNSLWSVSFDGGDVKQVRLVDGQHLLGNLVSSGPRLVSLGALGVACFEEPSAGQAWLQRQLASDPVPAKAILLKAQVLLAEGKADEAWKALRHLHLDWLDDRQRRQAEFVLEQCLRTVVPAKEAGTEAEETLRQLLQRQDRNAEWLQFAAERLIATERFDEALQTLWQLANLADSGKDQDTSQQASRVMLTWQGVPEVRVRADVWAAARLERLWRQMNEKESERRLFEQWLDEKQKQANQDWTTLCRLVRVLGFHPKCVELTFTVGDKLAEEGKWLKAESLLQRLAEADDPAVGARALTKIVKLLRDNGLPGDAALVLRELADRFPDHRLEDGKTASAAWQTLTKHHLSVGCRLLPDWTNSTWSVVREPGRWAGLSTGRYQVGRFSYWLDGPLAAPSLCQFQLGYDTSRQRLEVIRVEDGTGWWSVPLKTNPAERAKYIPFLVAAGRRLLVWHLGVLHCLDLYKRRVLWTYYLPESAASGTSNMARPVFSTFSPWPPRGMSVGTIRYAPSAGPLAFVTRKAIGLRSPSRLYVVDLIDGRLLWTAEGVMSHTHFVATDQAVLAVSTSDGTVKAYRLVDGHRVPINASYALIIEALYARGWRVTVAARTIASHSSGISTKDLLRQWDIRSGKRVWEVPVPGAKYFARLDQRTLVVVTHSGELELLDLETGKLQKLEQPASPSDGTSPTSSPVAGSPYFGYVLDDGAQFYLIVTRPGGGVMGGLPNSVRAHGTITAYDRFTGRCLWHKEIQNHTLTWLGLKQLPFLLFGSYRPRQKGPVAYRELALQLWDKRTGRTLLQTSLPTLTAYPEILLDWGRKELILQTFNERVRLVAQ